MAYKLVLRDIRKSQKLTQSELASMVGVTARIVSSWERGETELTLADAYNCAHVLGCTPNDLCAFPARGQVPPETRDPLRDELVRAYDACDGPRRVRLVETARDAAGMSGEVPERRVHVAEGVA